MVGPPLGGLVLGLGSAAGVFALDLVAALVMIMVLVMIKPPFEVPITTTGESVLRQAWQGVRTAGRTPGIPPLYAATALVAAGVLPVMFLCLPLLARERGWSAATTGWIEGCWVGGSLAITIVIARWGILFRAGRAMIIGPLLAGAGAVLLAAAPTLPSALAGSTLMGLGTITFTGHLAPLLLHWTPDAMVARFQALFVLVQSAPQLITIAGLGAVAGLIGPGVATTGAGIVCAAAGLVVAASARLRTATRPIADKPSISINETPGPDSGSSG